VIAPPLAIDGAALTIRKFKKDKLKLAAGGFGSITQGGRGQCWKIIGKSRCNVVMSGGTGSGKTTLLNCLTGYRRGRAHHHLRRRRRTSAAAAPRCAPRNPPAQP
jgi:Flp pilus assembly CpaF family ATPase